MSLPLPRIPNRYDLYTPIHGASVDCDGLVAPIPVLPLFLRYRYNILPCYGGIV